MDEQCLKKESTESKGFNRNNGLNRGEEHPRKRPESVNINSTASSHRATAKSEELKSVHSITETDGWTTWTVLSHPRRWTLNFSNRTRLHCGTFLTECNSTAVTPHYLTTGSATIPMPPYVNTGNTPALRHTTSIPVPAPHYAIPSSICPSPFILQGLGLYRERYPSENKVKN